MGFMIGVLDLAKVEAEEDFDDGDPEDFRADIEILNRFLTAKNYEPYVEPGPLPEFRRRSSGYHSFFALQELRRLYVCVLEGKELPRGEISDQDLDLIRSVGKAHPESHLLHHSDFEGYYIPREMPNGPLSSEEIPGYFLGSSQGLIGELMTVSEALDLELVDGKISVPSLKKLKAKGPDNPLYQAAGIWISLYESAQYSVTHRVLVIFN